MSGIRTSIELQDGFSDVLDRIVQSANMAVSTMGNLEHAMNANINTTSLSNMRGEIESTLSAVEELQSKLQNTMSPTVSAEVSPIQKPDNLQVPVTPVVTEQPQIDVPDGVRVDVTPVVTNQPDVDVPDGIEVPVTPTVTEQPQIDVPTGIDVDVTPVVTQQPEINVPDNLQVPVTPVVTEQPQIDVPEMDVNIDSSSVQDYNEQLQQMRGLLEQVSSVQQSINTYSQNVNILPDDERVKIQNLNAEIEKMNQALNMIENNPFDMPTEAVEQQIVSLINRLREASQEQLHLNELLSHMDIEVENPPPVEIPVQQPDPVRVPVEQPDPVTIPVQWESDNLEVFTTTGIERWRQEVASADQMLEQLSATQDSIARQAYNTNIFPPEAFQDLNTLAVRIDMVRDRIQQIENNRLNFGTDEANAGMEQLRAQLADMIQTQNRLNQAMDNMDVADANAEYLRLSQTVSQTERNIRDNVTAQGAFNQEIQEGASSANTLMDGIKGVVAAYATVQTVQNVLNISDELTQTTARLNLMNDGVRTTDELVKMVYASAQDARGGFSEMADVVARFGNNAKDAFSSTEEVVAFSNLIQKQMTIAGASTEEASNAMLQLSQALGSGVLRGDELNSIFEQAPNLIQNIADYLQVPIGEIRQMAADGELTADTVKAAIFSAADDINAKFEQMPMTWGQLWTSFTNTAVMAFQPVLQRLNAMANSEAFQSFVSAAVQALATVANIVLNIFDLIGSVAGFVADNWSIISPIIYGIIGALAVYYGWLGLVKLASLAEAAATGIAAVAKGIMAAATVVLTGATWAQATAQMGLNSAMYACPLVWIIILIIALIAIIYAVCSAIANLTGIANTGFGVITGGINVVIQFFKNLGLTVANIALGIASAISALAHNIVTAFSNAIANVQTFFYNLLSTVMSVISQIANALNKLPFVEFDASGLVAAADSYAAKAAEAQASKGEYESISEAFSDGFSTFDTFQSGWVSEAFDSGASWGDGVMDKISNFSLSDMFGSTDIPNVEDYTSGFDDTIQTSLDGIDGIGGIGSDVGSIADNTGAIADSMDMTEEELKYLRDIAETEAVNRYTVAEINIDQSGMQNNINSNLDIDGFMGQLTDSVNEAVDNMTEGVHE